MNAGFVIFLQSLITNFVLCVFAILVNMKGYDAVGMKDFELLKVLGTGGNQLSSFRPFSLLCQLHYITHVYEKRQGHA
jgi:hypothetical protein